MNTSPPTLPPRLSALLTRLDASLGALYRERYRGLLLFGAWARGGAEPHAKVELLLLLDGAVDTVHELLRSEDAVWPASFEAGYSVAVFPVSVRRFERSDERFLAEARRDGVRVP